MKQKKGAELRGHLRETAIVAREGEGKSSSLYAEEQVEKNTKRVVQQGQYFALKKRKQTQVRMRRGLIESIADEKMLENPVQREEKRKFIRYRQVQSIKKKQACVGGDFSEKIEQSIGDIEELEFPFSYMLFRKNRNQYNRKQSVAFKRGRKGWLPLGGGVFVLLFVIVILFAGAIALYGSEDEEFSPDANIVEIAESQIGNVGGMKFWKWYGFNEPVDWCACFVSWCAEQCGYIDTEKMPKFSYCQDGVNWFISHKSWYSKMISPQPGMIIFFDWDGNGISDHVGIVKKCKDGIVYTIEGNSGNICREMMYAVGGGSILGYGLIGDS